jgi:hypothetical protein
LTIDFSDYASGMYFIKAQTGDCISVKKIFIRHS